jgi:hypothetical protein
VLFVLNFTDVRAEVNVTAGGKLIENTTLTEKDPADWKTGDNVVYNDTATREIRIVFNGASNARSNVVITGARCAGGPCIVPLPPVPVDPYDFTNKIRRWSDRYSWSSGDEAGELPQ